VLQQKQHPIKSKNGSKHATFSAPGKKNPQHKKKVASLAFLVFY
jgi:hypothetical protein